LEKLLEFPLFKRDLDSSLERKVSAELLTLSRLLPEVAVFKQLCSALFSRLLILRSRNSTPTQSVSLTPSPLNLRSQLRLLAKNSSPLEALSHPPRPSPLTTRREAWIC
jgi:hypothetical protein